MKLTALPKAGRNYVVRDVRLGLRIEGNKKTGDVSLLLVGLENPKAQSKAGLEYGFRADRFRLPEAVESFEAKSVTMTEANGAVHQLGECEVTFFQ